MSDKKNSSAGNLNTLMERWETDSIPISIEEAEKARARLLVVMMERDKRRKAAGQVPTIVNVYGLCHSSSQVGLEPREILFHGVIWVGI